MGDSLAGVRETFETAHKVLHASDATMEAFGGLLRRIRHPRNGVPPGECLTPDVLYQRLKDLHSFSEQLEICYLYDPASKADILRALSSRQRVPVPAMLNVTAETHVEAVYLVGSEIYWSLQSMCGWFWSQGLAIDYAALDITPGFASECDKRANRVRDYMRNGPVTSNTLDFLRMAVAVEEATCREFFNPAATPQRHDNQQNGKNSVPLNPDVRDLCFHLKTKLSEFSSMAACARDFCSKNGIDEKKAEDLLRQAKRYRQHWET